MKYLNYLIGAATVALLVLAAVLYFAPTQTENFVAGVSQFAYDTTSKGFTQTTSTINTTSTNVFASIAKVNYIVNNTTSTLTCSLDPANTTAASSSVASGRGVIIGPNTGTQIPSIAAIGQCYPGITNCYLHTGAVNCLADAAKVVDKLVQ